MITKPFSTAFVLGNPFARSVASLGRQRAKLCSQILPFSTWNDDSIDWDDRLALQARWSLAEKRWNVPVEWKDTGSHGIGLFLAPTSPMVAKGTILRVGILGENVVSLQNMEEVHAFCSQQKENFDPEDYQKRVRYVKDYLWGFPLTGVDEGGYVVDENNPPERFYGMWVPGNGLNHSTRPNTVYRSSDKGIDLVALCDLEPGQELVDDYRRHGRAPEWLAEFAAKHEVTLNFAGCNDFVNHF